MSIYTPYTYLIGWSHLNKWYYGCSYKSATKKANPDQLWKSYFTSSKIVKNFRKKYGEPDIIQIRKKFNTAEQALQWEAKVIIRMNMVNDQKFLNQRNMSGKFRNKSGYCHTEKSKENYRKSFTEDRKQKLSILSIKNNSMMSKESRKKAGEKNSKTRKENREKYIKENSLLYNKSRNEKDKASIAIATKEAMNDPILKEHLSQKAKLRCTPEWRAKKSEENKYRICCIKCHREMGRSSLGKHLKGRRCI